MTLGGSWTLFVTDFSKRRIKKLARQAGAIALAAGMGLLFGAPGFGIPGAEAQDAGNGMQSPASARSATRTELSVSTLEGKSRTQARFTAQVMPADAGGPTPTGSVSLFRGQDSIGAAVLDSDGKAILTVDALPQGIQKITAAYQGDETHTASNSAAVDVSSVTSGVAGFTLTATPTSLSIPVGTSATTVIAVTPESGFNQAVSLSCSGLPYASATCTFIPAAATPGAPTSAAPNGTVATSTLTIQTQAASGALTPPPGRPEGHPLYALVLPGALALAGIASMRKRAFGSVRLLGLTALLIAGGLGLSSCAARYNYFHKKPAGNPGTPLGTYTVTISGITGTGSSLSTGAVNLTLTVTK